MSLLLTIQAAHGGLKVASEGINVVGHNTANATSDGYSRRTMVSTAAHPLQRGGHWLGQGAKTMQFLRQSDVFVERQIVKNHGQQTRAKTAFESIRMLEAQLSDGAKGSLVEGYNHFIDSLKQLTEDPGDTIFRSQLLTDAENFTNSVQEVGRFLDDRQQSVREDLELAMSEINALSESIAEHNRRIRRSSNTMSNSDLIDQRDRLIAEVSKLIGVEVHFKADNQATVFFNGHPLVQGIGSRDLSYSEDSAGRPVFFLETNSGQIDVTAGLKGEFGGKLDAYDASQDLLDDLDTFVIDFSTDFNTQHASGFDLNGNAGGDFFSFNSIAPTTSFSVDSTLLSDVTLIAAAGAATAEYGDRDNLDLLLDIDEVAMFSSGAYTPRQFLTSIYADLAKKVAENEMDYEMYTTQITDMFDLRSSISGVDLDQEAMKLMEYQASYEAAARVLTVSNQLLGELMQLL